MTSDLMTLMHMNEGCKLVAWSDGNKYLTIGWGHYGPDVMPGTMWTQAKADQQLVDDLNPTWDEVVAVCRKDTLGRELDAFTSFAYNEGVEAFKTSTLLKVHNQRMGPSAIVGEFRKWNLDNGVVVRGLVMRREREAKFYLGQNWQNDLVPTDITVAAPLPSAVPLIERVMTKLAASATPTPAAPAATEGETPMGIIALLPTILAIIGQLPGLIMQAEQLFQGQASQGPAKYAMVLSMILGVIPNDLAPTILPIVKSTIPKLVDLFNAVHPLFGGTPGATVPDSVTTVTPVVAAPGGNG